MKITLIPYKQIIGVCKNCGKTIHNKKQIVHSWTGFFERETRLYYCTECSYMCCCGHVEWIEDKGKCLKCDNLVCSDCYIGIGDSIYCNGCAFYCQGCEEGAPREEQQECIECGMTGCIKCLDEIERLYYCEDHRPDR